jgi:hypothetical protein
MKEPGRRQKYIEIVNNNSKKREREDLFIIGLAHSLI